MPTQIKSTSTTEQRLTLLITTSKNILIQIGIALKSNECWHRSHLPTMNNNINNRVESANAKLKQFIKKNSKMNICIEGLLNYLKFKGKQKQRMCIKNVHNATDPIIKQINKICSQYSAKFVVSSYRTLLASKYKFEKVENNFNVFSHRSIYNVTDLQSKRTCTCLSSTNMMFPCKHIFFLRRTHNLPIFDEEMIPLRWKPTVSVPITISHDSNRFDENFRF